jgi:hypothetical protein
VLICALQVPDYNPRELSRVCDSCYHSINKLSLEAFAATAAANAVPTDASSAAPEHVEAGALVRNSLQPNTLSLSSQLPLISLHQLQNKAAVKLQWQTMTWLSIWEVVLLEKF